MDVVSTCPLRVASIVWQPRPSAWTLTVVCKATFVLLPGESRLADVQEEPISHDRHLANDPARSLHAASDLAPWKPRADVVLVGSAFAPQRRPARAVATRLNVGEIDKRIDVWCDRVFWQDGRLLEGQPFAQMPLAYERAAGGPGTENPVGMRFDASPDAYGSVPIPSLQPAGLQIARRGDTFAPIAYGPLAPAWPGRLDKLARHAAGWSHRGWSALPLPADIDPAYFNSAPPDQQIASIRPDERIVLEGLHAEHAALETRLPGLRPRAHLLSGASIQEEIELVADTLWIDTDRGLATVVWRGQFALSHAREEGRITVSIAAPPALHAAQGPTLPGDDGDEGGATMRLPSSEVAALLGGLRGLDAAALPFKAAPSVWAGFQPTPAASPEAPLPEDTGTLFGARLPAREILPFSARIAPLELDPTPEPERIGPLARPDIAAPLHDVKSTEPPFGLAADEPAALDERALRERYPIERCAAITASVDQRRAQREAILQENELTTPAWSALEQSWDEAIDAEVARGQTDLLRRFDAAYVAQIESERGPIEAADYARLVVAAERGTTESVLAELALPAEAELRIERVWLDKGVGDRALRERIVAARQAP